MNQNVRLERRGNVGVIVIDHPPVNALSRNVIVGLHDAITLFEQETNLVALVIHGAGASFVAGGDITTFDAPDFETATYNNTLARIEAMDRPVVAALHGHALGGGLELALACHARVATADTRLGFPEIRLGLLPGSLGTQRLPRLIGIPLALDLMLEGRSMTAREALVAGLVDEVSPEVTPLSASLALVEAMVAQGTALRRTAQLPMTVDSGTSRWIEDALLRADAHKLSPQAAISIVRCVHAAATAPFEEGGVLEAQLFDECRRSAASQALRHIFLAERAAAKIGGFVPQAGKQPVETVGVLGAGTMGGGIAITFADAGLHVVLVENSADALERGLARLREHYESAAARGKMSPADARLRMDRLHGTLDRSALGACDLVIEAVYEQLEVKLAVCAELGRLCHPGAIIATNTSTLDVDVLAAATGRPEDVVGMHFFSPANVMRLLEVVRGRHTRPEVLAAAMQLARRIGKTAVVSGVCYGFIGNRMAEVYMRETEFLLMEGATPAQVDHAVQATQRWGMAMGPCRMLDLAGIDVGARTVIEYQKIGGLPPDPCYRALVRRLFEAGRHGQKTGRGYYRYEGRAPLPDPEFERICEELAAYHQITRRADIPNEEIVERLLYPMVNEAARILEEGIAARPGDIDVVWCAGYGFPGARGGPLFMADREGLAHIVQRMRHYASCGDPFGYWRVSPLLERLAAQGATLSDLTHLKGNITQ